MLRGSKTVAEAIGNTPLIRLNQLTRDLPENVEVYAKAEWMNPGGSVKDRAARGIVLDAIAAGQLKKGGVLLDASSGNTGIAYAMLAPALGFSLKLCLPSNAKHAKKSRLRSTVAPVLLNINSSSSTSIFRT